MSISSSRQVEAEHSLLGMEIGQAGTGREACERGRAGQRGKDRNIHRLEMKGQIVQGWVGYIF